MNLINQDQIYFSVSNNINTKTISPKKIIQDESKYSWQHMNKFFNKKGYILFENNTEKDIDCGDSYISSPTLALKYENININDYDEITDIDIKMKVTGNKEDIVNNTAINLYKDADYYMPNNGVAKKTYYPNRITNVYEEYVSHISIQQPNITICSNCLKTTLGYYDECPHCNSEYVLHYNDKKAVTICYDCGYIIDGWHDYCTHCLSNDIEKTKVDFNKTYCNKCGNLEDDYYSHCPKCFSDDVVHLNNDEYKYVIKSDSTQNINPIIIKSDVDRINVCNITLPFNVDTVALKQFEYLRLHIYGTNHNDGKFYFCPSCGSVGLGNVTNCEECGMQSVENYSFDNVTMDIYVEMDGTYHRIDSDTEYDQLKGEFDIAIDLQELANKNIASEFKLLIYVENLLYDKIDYQINKLDIDYNSYEFLNDNILAMNISIDNIYYESKYKNTNEWKGLDQLIGTNHTNVMYHVVDETETDYINFSDFNLDQRKYDKLTLYVDGLNKSHSNIIMHLLVLDKNENVLYNSEMNVEEEVGSYNISINPDLFVYQEDLATLIDRNKLTLVDTIKIAFKKITEDIDIAITDCHIVGEFERHENVTNLDVKKYDYEIIQDNSLYRIRSKDNFGLKDAAPGYVDGQQLKNSLVCFIDFGSLNANEYIRLYDVDLLITYKNKYGQLITEAIDNTDNTYTECLINGNVIKNEGDNWTSIKTSVNILNNLEYEIINNGNEDDLSAISLNQNLAQSFTLTQNNLGTIVLSYFGQVGNPNKNIIVELYDDYNNTPDNLICSKMVTLPNIIDYVTIDFNIDYLNLEQYWIILKDPFADEYNHHRFRYNGNLNVGNLMHNDERDQNRVLCIDVYANINAYESYGLPFVVEDDIGMTFKVSEQLYRYNSQTVNTTSINDLSIQLGYRQYNADEEPDVDDNDYLDEDEEDIYYDEDQGDDISWN